MNESVRVIDNLIMSKERCRLKTHVRVKDTNSYLSA